MTIILKIKYDIYSKLLTNIYFQKKSFDLFQKKKKNCHSIVPKKKKKTYSESYIPFKIF